MVPDNEIKKAVDALKAGKVILYPTDTIWGIGCDATNAAAVQRIYDIKGRDERKALIILVERPEQLSDYVVKVPDIAWDIVEYAERPLTVIYPKAKNIADKLLAEDQSIGIRVVKDEFCQKLIRTFGKAIVSTSANFSGQPSPNSYSEIEPELISLVDHVVEFKKEMNTSAKPSMVMKLGINGEVKILRK
jgi:L-threonylcarbamoyladenylate synthase